MRTLLTVLCAVVLAGCGHTLVLTAAGQHVTRVERGHLPDGCRLVGDVTIGIPPDAALPATEDELITLMRNKAGTMGADRVVVENSALQPPEGTGQGHWAGSGSAYECTAGGEPAEEHGDAPHEDDGTTPPPETPPIG